VGMSNDTFIPYCFMAVNGYERYNCVLRFIHIFIPNLIFLLLFVHGMKAIKAKSYNRLGSAYVIGGIMYYLTVAAAFTGYSLVGGQQSFWAVVVITSLLSALPVLGQGILVGFWSGNSVTNLTVVRLYSIHFILPLIIFVMILLHLVLLHKFSSTGNLQIDDNNRCNERFKYSILLQDMRLNVFIFIIMLSFILISSYYLVNPSNSQIGDILVTPTNIVPESYFLYLYIILKSIPNKIIGIIIMLLVTISIFTK
jgi:quinol-cytochrome oxidoreductase complex cytochrome b subunit